MATRIASAAGGKCLLGSRLITSTTDQITNPKGGSNCDIALDVVMFNTGNLSIEADTTITDPYKVTAIGFHSAIATSMAIRDTIRKTSKI